MTIGAAEERLTSPATDGRGVARARRRLMSRADLAIGAGLAAATLAVSLYFAPRGFYQGFVDMGHDGYQLRQVLDLGSGGVIFKDTFDQYGPLGGYLNTFGFLAFGRRLLAIKYFLCVWYAFIAATLYAIARRWLAPGLAAFSTIVWLGLAPFYQHGIMISAHVYILLFQALATLIALRTPRLDPLPFAVVGVLAGLCAAAKTSMGVSFVASIGLYLLFRVALDRDEWLRVAKAMAALGIGFAAVLGVMLVFLWANGALHDWYLQTVVFPRQFYLDYAQPTIEPTGLVARLMPRMLVNFASVQAEQAFYWWIVRAVVVATVIARLVHRRVDNDFLLIGCITALLWLGVFASLNFMHQWWTISLSIAAFVVCVRAAVEWFVREERVRSWSTAAVVILIIGSGLIDRANATAFRASALTDAIVEPPMFRGIRTDATTRRAFEAMSQAVERYRAHHPGARLVTIDEADGWWTGVNESLPFLSFFEGNTHPHPVYWSLPILITKTYPDYSDALWADVKADHPLIVEQHQGWYTPRRIPGYRVLAAAQNERGNWYLYAPEHADSAPHGEVSSYMARDGKTESGFAEDDRVPQLAMRLSSNVEAAWRGRVADSPKSDDGAELPGVFPLRIHDRELGNVGGPVNVYTWPADLRIASIEHAVEPLSTEPPIRDEIVRELKPGVWTVDGYAPSQYSYLLKFRETPIEPGWYLVVRGEVLEGGFTIGFIQGLLWTAYVNVTRPGLFEVVLQVQEPGEYALTVANCLEATWWQRGWRYKLRSRLGLGAVGPNRFTVTAAGWIHSAGRAN
jgi:hypothetical protein